MMIKREIGVLPIYTNFQMIPVLFSIKIGEQPQHERITTIARALTNDVCLTLQGGLSVSMGFAGEPRHAPASDQLFA